MTEIDCNDVNSWRHKEEVFELLDWLWWVLILDVCVGFAGNHRSEALRTD